MKSVAVLTLSFLLVPVLRAGAATYVIDASHSSVEFRIRHLVGRVSGRFLKFEGDFVYDKSAPKTWTTSARIVAASIDTDNAKRDDHLRGPDFFDVGKCPSIEFKNAKVSEIKGDAAVLTGDLTMHCVTKPVQLNLVMGGEVKDPWGNMRAGAVATGRVNRKDFGISYNKTLDQGGLMLGDDVDITLEIEGILSQEKK